MAGIYTQTTRKVSLNISLVKSSEFLERGQDLFGLLYLNPGKIILRKNREDTVPPAPLLMLTSHCVYSCRLCPPARISPAVLLACRSSAVPVHP